MQNKLKEGPLLNEEGNLCEAGYAFSLVKKYDRNAIKARKSRIKEWDYYYIGDNKRGIAFTIADNSYMGMASVSYLNFEDKVYVTKSSMKAFTSGKLNLPSSSKEGELNWEDKNYSLHFKTEKGKRVLDVSVINYNEGKPFKSHIELEETMNDSMVIATPWDKPKHFYYNQKINSQKAQGYFEYGDEKYTFSIKDARAVLDWGRGVWTYKNTWYWSNLSTTDGNHEIGFNLGYGFGNTSAASENMLFYDKKAYKLNDVAFNIPMDDKGNYLYMEPWTFTSKDNDINLTFKPLLDRHDDTNLVILKSIQHQVFGIFNGTIKADGVEVKIKNAVSFAERVTNWY